MSKQPTLKLDPDFKAAWLKALRSDEYTQARNYLRVLDGEDCAKVIGMCCLGLGDLISREINPFIVRKEIENAVLGTRTPSLDNLNDAGWTFAQIADIIEEQF